MQAKNGLGIISAYSASPLDIPDLSVVDASVALTGIHLAETKKKLGLILASRNPMAIDTVGSQWLGHDPRNIEYLKLANGRLGHMGLGQGITCSLDTASSA